MYFVLGSDSCVWNCQRHISIFNNKSIWKATWYKNK